MSGLSAYDHVQEGVLQTSFQLSLPKQDPIQLTSLRLSCDLSRTRIGHFWENLIACCFISTVVPTVSLHPKRVTLMAGSNLTLSCNVSGMPTPDLHWITCPLNSSHEVGNPCLAFCLKLIYGCCCFFFFQQVAFRVSVSLMSVSLSFYPYLSDCAFGTVLHIPTQRSLIPGQRMQNHLQL